jgi:hypothetical protein
MKTFSAGLCNSILLRIQGAGAAKRFQAFEDTKTPSNRNELKAIYLPVKSFLTHCNISV